MASHTTAGQQAAARHARARRGELGLSQEDLARKAGVSRRAYINFEKSHAWPNADNLAKIERLGLNWPVGYLAEYAATHESGHQAAATIRDEINGIYASDMAPDLKERLIARLEAIEGERLREQLERLTQRAASNQSPGEELEGDRRSA